MDTMTLNGDVADTELCLSVVQFVFKVDLLHIPH